jgi:probable rRNA maturation factor
MGASSRSPGGGAGPEIELLVAERRWRAAVPRLERLVRRALRAAAAEAGGLPRIALLLADDRAVKALNARHRGRAKPTNVLSFPAPGGGGEIALAFGVVRREARAAGKRVAAHLAHLVVHGALHLAGHDHAEAGEARRMERAEARALFRLGLPNPWRGTA